MKRPTPLEFAKTMLVIMIPAMLAFIIFITFVSCKTIEPTYHVFGDETILEYNDKQGNFIELPLNSDDCTGYKKPYHITQYNNVGNY